MSICRTPSPAPSDATTSRLRTPSPAPTEALAILANTPQKLTTRKLECPATPRHRPTRLPRHADIEMKKARGYGTLVRQLETAVGGGTWQVRAAALQDRLRVTKNSRQKKATATNSKTRQVVEDSKDGEIKEDPVVAGTSDALAGLSLGLDTSTQQPTLKRPREAGALGEDTEQQLKRIRYLQAVKDQFQRDGRTLRYMVQARRDEIEQFKRALHSERESYNDMKELEAFDERLEALHRPKMVRLLAELGLFTGLLEEHKRTEDPSSMNAKVRQGKRNF